jgi:glycosyltransferase 2 family protein
MPRRIRRPTDAIRFLLSLATLILILILAHIAKRTTSGLESDIVNGAERAPHILLDLANQASGFVVLAIPVIFAADRLIHRDGLRIAIGVLAAVMALGVSLLLDAWINAAGMHGIAAYLAWPRHGGWFPGPAHVDITPVIAFITAVRLAGRPRWQGVTWTVIGLDAVAALAAGNITPLAVLTTYVIGRAVGHGTLYAAGTPNTRPPGKAVVVALRKVGLEPLRAARISDGPEDTRRYSVDVTTPIPRTIDVTVLDRDQQTAGMLYRLWRRVRLRGATPRRTLRSLRRSLEQEALMAYATGDAGVSTPRLLATSEVGSEAALLAYEHVPGRSLAELADDELSDELLAEIWQQVKLLQAKRLAHRRLVDESLLIDDAGTVYLIDLRAGEIAANDIVLRIDLAQLLTDLALRVGPERAVRAAAQVLGPNALAGALPLLQKVALARTTRIALLRERKLLSRIREQIEITGPQVEVAPVRIDRFRLRTLVTIIAGAIGTYLLLSQLSNVNLHQLISSADWRWLAVGTAASAASYVAAAFMLIGFVPERLPFVRTVLVQLAGSFVKLVAPAAVSGVAVNTRYLQRSGVPTTQAAASVGASQLTGFTLHIALLLVFGYVSGSHSAPSLPPSRIIIIVLLTAAVLATVVAAVGPLRRLVVSRTRTLFSGVVPRLLDVLQSPKKLATGVGGALLLTATFVACLDASIQAFGGSLPVTTVAVVFLTGNALGSAAPTPGGLGAVEGALTIGLTLAGMPAGTATSAVLLFRLQTFWLPVLPGWASFSFLQRNEAI